MIHRRLARHGIRPPTDLIRSDGSVRMCCPRCSHQRRVSPNAKCLWVQTRRGFWTCHHCGWRDPVQNKKRGAARGGRYSKRCAPLSSPAAESPPAMPRPRQSASLGARLRRFLSVRGIDPYMAQRHGVCQMRVFHAQRQKTDTALVFEYRRNGVLVNRKMRFAGKAFQCESGCERLLWGVDDLGETTVIVEGELDRLAALQAGVAHVVSVPDGAPQADARNLAVKMDFLRGDAPRLAAVHRFIIATDDDAPGHRLAQALSQTLGPHRCVMAGAGDTPGYPGGLKDIGDVLTIMGENAVVSALNRTRTDHDDSKKPTDGAGQDQRLRTA